MYFWCTFSIRSTWYNGKRTKLKSLCSQEYPNVRAHTHIHLLVFGPSIQKPHKKKLFFFDPKFCGGSVTLPQHSQLWIWCKKWKINIRHTVLILGGYLPLAQGSRMMVCKGSCRQLQQKDNYIGNHFLVYRLDPMANVHQKYAERTQTYKMRRLRKKRPKIQFLQSESCPNYCFL